MSATVAAEAAAGASHPRAQSGDHASSSHLRATSPSSDTNSSSKPSGTAKRSKSLSKPSAQKDGSREATRSESPGGAVVRALFGTLAFLFKRPVRLFRPVKLSSWTILEAIAKREGRQLSLRYLRSVLKRERSSFLPHLLLPPLLFNTAIGFTLFEAYSITEARLLAKSRRVTEDELPGNEQTNEIIDRTPLNSEGSDKPQWTPLWIVTASGAVAGAAQCFLSAPLDNVRYIIQHNTSNAETGRGRRGRSDHRHAATISWRAILRAAILPFAPAIAHDKLVQSVHAETIRNAQRPYKNSIWSLVFSSKTKTNVGQSTAAERSITPQKRSEWEKRLKRWRGGIHGSGLVLSLIRDSVGFGSFFFIFEVSRRCAFTASTSNDRISAWFNARALKIVRVPSLFNTQSEPDGTNDVAHIKANDNEAGSGNQMHMEGMEDVGKWIRQGQKGITDADISYNQSRTVQGRVIAVIILLIGGAVGAFSYEMVGRPFELMRVVIWEGRKEWEQGKREPGYKPSPSSAMQHARNASAASTLNSPAGLRSAPNASNHLSIPGRVAIKGARTSAFSDQMRHPIKRKGNILTLRRRNSMGRKESRITAWRSLGRSRHPLTITGAIKAPLSSQQVNHPISGISQSSPQSTAEAKRKRNVRRVLTTSPALCEKKYPPTLNGSRPSDVTFELEPTTKADLSVSRRSGKASQYSPTLATRPGFLTLLVEHAQSTAELDYQHSGGPNPSRTPILLLLLHTYFVAPFLPEIPRPILDNQVVRTATGVDRHLNSSSSTSSPKTVAGETVANKVATAAQRTLLMSLVSRRRSAESPEAKVKRHWTRDNPVNNSFAAFDATAAQTKMDGARTHMTPQGAGARTGGLAADGKGALKQGTRYWASGRVGWALKRLATPYGVAFLVFAWLGGDLN